MESEIISRLKVSFSLIYIHKFNTVALNYSPIGYKLHNLRVGCRFSINRCRYFILAHLVYFYTKLQISTDMALVKAIKGKSPKWGKNCYMAENATLVGDVTMGDSCSLWFNQLFVGTYTILKLE